MKVWIPGRRRAAEEAGSRRVPYDPWVGRFDSLLAGADDLRVEAFAQDPFCAEVAARSPAEDLADRYEFEKEDLLAELNGIKISATQLGTPIRTADSPIQFGSLTECARPTRSRGSSLKPLLRDLRASSWRSRVCSLHVPLLRRRRPDIGRRA